MAIPTYVQKPLCSKILFLKFIFSHCVIYLVYFVLLRPLMVALSLLILSTFNSISIYISLFFSVDSNCVIPTVLYQQHFFFKWKSICMCTCMCINNHQIWKNTMLYGFDHRYNPSMQKHLYKFIISDSDEFLIYSTYFHKMRSCGITFAIL